VLARVYAFLLHAVGSIGMAAMALCLVYLVWYPAPLADAVGVTDVILMLLGVDVVIGPLLTLMVYKVEKKHLKSDIACIVLVQLVAFVFGMHAVFTARPAWIVYSGHRFDLVQANGLDSRFQSEAATEFRHAPWWGPRWIAAKPPADARKRNQLILESFAGGADMPQRPDLYVPLVQESQALKKNGAPLVRLGEINGPGALAQVQKHWPDADTFYPLMTKGKHMTVLIDSRTARIVGVVALRPFK
jgi:hypothetical protein